MTMALIEGALSMAVGVLLGRYLPERKKQQKPVQPVCGCDHHYSMHDRESGKCSAAVRISRYNGGSWVGYDYPACACRRYSGPEPLPSYYAPEIAGGAS